MIRENDMVYICSPPFALMQLVSEVFRCRAVFPSAYLPEHLDYSVLWERKLGSGVGMKLLEHSQALVVFSPVISCDMQAVIVKARELGVPVYTLLMENLYIGVVQAPFTLKGALT